MTCEELKRRLESGFRTLVIIDRRRGATAAPGIGTAIEREVVNRELEELWKDLIENPPVFPKKTKK